MLKEVQTLLARLAEADRAWQREKSRALAARFLPVFLGLAVLALVLDAFLQLGASTRFVLLLLGGLAALGAAAAVWAVGWRRRNPPERVARHLETRDPALGSSLINALQLADQSGDTTVPELTRQLAARAVGRYGESLDGRGLRDLAVTGEARRRWRHAAWAGAVFAVLVLGFFPVTSVVVPRWLDPFGDHPPYAFTRVELVDPGEAGADVVYGGRLTVKARWSGHAPRELFLTLASAADPARTVTLPMIRDGENGFSQEVPDVKEPLRLVAHSRNRGFFSKQRDVRVILTPKIEKGFLETAPPAYTGIQPEERPFAFASASALAGGTLTFRLKSNRPLRGGGIEVVGADETAWKVPMRPVAEHEVAGALTLTNSVRVRFRVTDVDGLESEPTAEALVSATHDLPPTVRLVEPAQDGFVTLDYPLTLKVDASDDYGVRQVRLHRGLNGLYSAPRTLTVEDVRRDAGMKVPLDLATLGVRPGDRLSFFAEAIDTRPEPQLARSQTVTLLVITPQEYNDYLREEMDVRDLSGKYDQLLERFQELRAEQSKLAEAAAELARKAAAGDTNALRADALDRLMARQNELNQQLNQQAEAMEKLVRDDPLYDFEKDLQRQLAEEAAMIRRSTSTNDAALQQLAQATSQNGQRSISAESLETMQREAREQAQRLGERERSLAESVQKPLEDLGRLHDLMNDFSAFQELYRAQQQLAEQAAAYEHRGKLNREDQLALKELAARQQAVREMLDLLPERLREHAEAAEEKFPKAAESGRELARQIEQTRLAPMAADATGRMLDADGEQSAQLSRRLEQDMARLFAQCQGNQPGQSGDELDQFLRLSLGGQPGQSLEQMQMCRKLGLQGGLFPQMGRGKGQGTGTGYSQTTSPQLAVLGNEQQVPKGPKESSSKAGANSGAGQGTAGQGLASSPEKPEVLKGLNPGDRRSDAVTGESSIEPYRDVVDEYFKAITRRP